MCLEIDPNIKALNKRIVWKVFDKETGKIASLYRGEVYPKGKLVTRSPGPTTFQIMPGKLQGTRGLHFFSTKALAIAEAENFSRTRVAQFAVDPADFMFANADKSQLMYESATRVGNYIKVKQR